MDTPLCSKRRRRRGRPPSLALPCQSSESGRYIGKWLCLLQLGGQLAILEAGVHAAKQAGGSNFLSYTSCQGFGQQRYILCFYLNNHPICLKSFFTDLSRFFLPNYNDFKFSCQPSLSDKSLQPFLSKHYMQLVFMFICY